MPAATHRVAIDRPIEEVFDYLADPENDMTWRQEVMSINRVSGSGVGAVYEQRVPGPGGRAVAADIEITKMDRPKLIEFRTIAGPVRPTGRYSLTAKDGSTELEFSLEATIAGVKRLFASMVQKTMEQEVRAIEMLKTVLETR